MLIGIFYDLTAVLEFMAGGQIVWQDESKNPTMTVDEARRTFRDVVLGLEYRTLLCHLTSLLNHRTTY